MCTSNPQPLRPFGVSHFEREEPTKVIPQEFMLVITRMGRFEVYMPGELVTDEMYSEMFLWEVDQEKAKVLRNQMVLPDGKVLMVPAESPTWRFVYPSDKERVDMTDLRTGHIVDSSANAIDAMVSALRK